jgi:hypothetical protein
MQNKGIKIIFIGIFFLGLFLYPFSAKADPPDTVAVPNFEAIMQKIEEEKTKIQNAKNDGSCAMTLGDSLVFRFRLSYLGAKDFMMSKLQIGKSKCFLRDQRKIERGIVQLVQSFSKSSLACSKDEVETFSKEIDDLEGLLRDFRDTYGKNSAYATKDCSIDARSYIFSETISSLDRLKTKIKEISENVQSMKKGNFFSFNSSAIKGRAQQNADDFWGDVSRIFDFNIGLRAEYSRISSRIRGLGSASGFYSDPVNGNFRDREENIKEFERRREEVLKKLDTFASLIEEKKKTDSEGQEYAQRYLQRKFTLEEFLDFDMALSDIGQVPLIQMRGSIDTTTESLENALDALKKYNNRTNVAKETK